MNLRHGTMTIFEYHTGFIQLLRYVIAIFPNEGMIKERFEDELCNNIRVQMTTITTHIMNECAEIFIVL